MSFRNVDRHWRLAFFVVVLPMAVAIVYYVFFAVDRYVSSAQVVVGDQSGNAAQQVPGLALLMSSLNPVSRQETLYVSQYITSFDMLNVLEEKLNWHQQYAKQWKDPLFWVASKINREELLEYYRRLVTVTYDDATGLLHVSVQGLTPRFAQETLKVILDASERFVNNFSKHIARDQVRFAQEELKKARLNYEEKRDALIQFQNDHKLLDAQAAAQSQAAIIAALESNLATERANLKGLLSSLKPDAPQVRQQRIKIDALERQLATEKNLLASPTQGHGEHMNSVAANFRKLMVDAQISEDAYKLSVSALENARIEANKKVHSLLTVVTPNLPEGALYPDRIYNLCTLFVVLLFVYGLTRFIIASIEDHRD
jgi:capsular polysaccharide transport system permease protein